MKPPEVTDEPRLMLDCCEPDKWLAKRQEGSADLCIMEPDIHVHRQTRNDNTRRFARVASILATVLKDGACCYVWAQKADQDVVKRWMTQAGFRFRWEMSLLRLQSGYPAMLFVNGDVCSYANIHPGDLMMGSKAVERIVSGSSPEGGVIIDPYMGASCLSGVAAVRLGRQFWGCDDFDKAVDRAKAAVWRVYDGAKTMPLDFGG